MKCLFPQQQSERSLPIQVKLYFEIVQLHFFAHFDAIMIVKSGNMIFEGKWFFTLILLDFIVSRNENLFIDQFHTHSIFSFVMQLQWMQTYLQIIHLIFANLTNIYNSRIKQYMSLTSFKQFNLLHKHHLTSIIIMANSDEPATTGTIILYTSVGDLQIELWARQAPLACRNFIQLCMEGYYDQTIFHRVIPGFMAQGGDPTGTGSGGNSIYGSPFKDQFHQRLKFNKQGIVAMANTSKDSNQSQFFITFGECTHLNKKNTIIGKVVGNTVYNLMSMQSVETDQNDRPLQPPYIKKTKILLNPFDDIKPRKKIQEKIIDQNEIKKKNNKKTAKQLKQRNKLTFDYNIEGMKVKSSHQVLNDKNLSKQSMRVQEIINKNKEKKYKEQKEQEQIKAIKQQLQTQNKINTQNIPQTLKEQIQRKILNYDQSTHSNQENIMKYHKKINLTTNKMEIVWEDQQEQLKEIQQQQLRKIKLQQLEEYQNLKADQLNFKKSKEGSHKPKFKQLVEEELALLSNLQRNKYEFRKKHQLACHEGQIFDKLRGFRDKLRGELEGKQKWAGHKLKFDIDSENAYKLEEKKREAGHKELGDGLKFEVGGTQSYKQRNIDELYDLVNKQ